MNLKTIRCQNFFSHRDTNINFEDVGSPVLVTGENGAGKSSAISEALVYAIFGDLRMDSVDDAIRNNENEMIVTIEFAMSGQEVIIERRKKRGKTQKLGLWIDGTIVSELLSETQKHIEKLIPLSYDAFRSSVILRQEDADFFVSQKPDDRKKIIAEILDLNAYERLEKLAREKRADIKAEIKAEQNVLLTLEEEDVDSLRDDLTQVEEHLVKFVSKIEKAQIALNKIQATNAHISKEQERYNKAILGNLALNKQIATNRETLTTKQSEIKVLNAQAVNDQSFEIELLELGALDLYDESNVHEKEEANYIQLKETEEERIKNEIKNALLPLEQKLAVLKSNRKTAMTTLKEHKAGGLECSACKRAFADAEERLTYIKEIETALAKTDKQIEKVEASIREVEEKFTNTENLAEYLNKIKITKEKQANVSLEIRNNRKNIRQLQTIQLEYVSAGGKKDTICEAIKSLNAMIAQLKSQIQEIEPQDFDFQDDSTARTKVNELRAMEKEALKMQTQLEQRIEQGIKGNEKRKALALQMNSRLTRLNHLEKLCTAFSRKGVPAAIIETVLPEIQDTTNEYLDRMSDGSLAIRFNTIATLKNGDQRETLEIEVYDGQNWRIFESFSGGEKFRVSLSIRLALSRVLARRAGVDLELLVLDEPASPLDPEGRDAFCSTIKSLSSYFSRIVLMSHLQDLQENFEHRINLSKSENGTKVLK